MKALALIALLLVSIVFLGCVQEQPPGGTTGGETPQLEEQSFGNESQAFNALENELTGVEDVSASELENALQG